MRTMNRPPSALRTTLRTMLWAVLLLGGSLAMHLFTYSTFVVNSDLDHQRDFNDGYKVFSLSLPQRAGLLRGEGATATA
jgi:hypothetical protein